ncbi:MAG: LON peptidase substrate-binding domain-containing protein [Ahrensia sp.]|nr:LON peptidase substrate-binding domain-containing protein [Ahrensia sp.]
MKAGLANYVTTDDLPATIPVFPLSGAMLLPAANMPLNLFEPRYLAMFDDALRSDRLIGMIQPDFKASEEDDTPLLCDVGCVGRITAFQETTDNRIIINLAGVARFRVLEEVEGRNGYRRARVEMFAGDIEDHQAEEKAVDRTALLKTFRRFLEANDLEADWNGVREASTETLVNSLSMMSPFDSAEKQALLEAPDLKTRAETLIAIAEMFLARSSADSEATLQ